MPGSSYQPYGVQLLQELKDFLTSGRKNLAPSADESEDEKARP